MPKRYTAREVKKKVVFALIDHHLEDAWKGLRLAASGNVKDGMMITEFSMGDIDEIAETLPRWLFQEVMRKYSNPVAEIGFLMHDMRVDPKGTSKRILRSR